MTAESLPKLTSGSIRVDRRERIAVVVIDRPDKLNALSIPMLKDLRSVLRHLGSDPGTAGIVVTGTGRAFSAGDDLPATENLEKKDFDELLGLFQDLTRAVLSSQVPVLAALNGISVGGAAEFTLAC